MGRERAKTFADRLPPVLPREEPDIAHLPDEMADKLQPEPRSATGHGNTELREACAINGKRHRTLLIIHKDFSLLIRSLDPLLDFVKLIL